MVDTMQQSASRSADRNDSPEVVIVGAGPAGLATAACLRRSSVSFVILERANNVGSAWRRHYERLHLHTTKRVSSLPHFAFPDEYPRYPSRDQMIEYLERYARAFDIRPEFDQEVISADPVAGGWTVRTSDGTHTAPNLVVATGINCVPHVPHWSGTDDFQGTVLHSSDYRNGRSWEGRRVLVIGFGNSGGEIALDLWEHGAQPTVAVRGPANVVPREVVGIPITSIGRFSRRMSPLIGDLITSPLLRLTIGDLTRFGLDQPRRPLRHVRESGRVPLIDVGTIRLIKKGLIAVRPGVRHFTRTGVVFDDDRDEDFDAVVLATGFRPGWDRFLRLPGIDAISDVTTAELEDRFDGLYFCGFSTLPTGMLGQIVMHSQRIAAAIAARANK